MTDKDSRTQATDSRFTDAATRSRWSWVHNAISQAKQQNQNDLIAAESTDDAGHAGPTSGGQ